MRPIDADAIKSVEKEIVCGKTRSPYEKDYTAILRVFEVDEIRNAPTLDCVPVIRCAECEHGMGDLFHPGYTICNYMRCTMKNDGYCSNALRRK